MCVLNPISLRDRGELVPASELASYPVDRADDPAETSAPKQVASVDLAADLVSV